SRLREGVEQHHAQSGAAVGGMLIGWIAGSMLVSDPTIRQLFPSAGEGTARLAGAVGALLVLFTGWRRRPRPQAKD
ncbi:hypothetical protein ACLBPK_28440, partial [Klebsiella pneumoniae]